MSSLLFVSSGNSSALVLRQRFPFRFAFNSLHDFHFASICFMTFDWREYSSLRCCAHTLAIFLINNANGKKKNWNLILTSFKKFKTKLELLKIGNCHGFVTVITKRWFSFSGFPFKRFFLISELKVFWLHLIASAKIENKGSWIFRVIVWKWSQQFQLRCAL